MYIYLVASSSLQISAKKKKKNVPPRLVVTSAILEVTAARKGEIGGKCQKAPISEQQRLNCFPVVG